MAGDHVEQIGVGDILCYGDMFPEILQEIEGGLAFEVYGRQVVNAGCGGPCTLK